MIKSFSDNKRKCGDPLLSAETCLPKNQEFWWNSRKNGTPEGIGKNGDIEGLLNGY